MTGFCPTCGGRGWLRRFTCGGHPEPVHCHDCGDGAVDPVGFESSDLDLADLKCKIRPSTSQHATAD